MQQNVIRLTNKACHCEQMYIKSSAAYGSAANNPHTSKTELVEVHSVGHVYLELVKRPIGFSITHNDGQNALSEQGTAFCLCYVVHF